MENWSWRTEISGVGKIGVENRAWIAEKNQAQWRAKEKLQKRKVPRLIEGWPSDNFASAIAGLDCSKPRFFLAPSFDFFICNYIIICVYLEHFFFLFSRAFPSSGLAWFAIISAPLCFVLARSLDPLLLLFNFFYLLKILSASVRSEQKIGYPTGLLCFLNTSDG